MRDEIIRKYDDVVAMCPRFDRKGKANPYTSVNGHMFSQINKAGELGIRFSKEVQEKYIKEFGSDYFKSYGAIMRGYVLIPNDFWNKPDKIARLLNESFDYILTLEPK